MHQNKYISTLDLLNRHMLQRVSPVDEYNQTFWEASVDLGTHLKCHPTVHNLAAVVSFDVYFGISGTVQAQGA